MSVPFGGGASRFVSSAVSPSAFGPGFDVSPDGQSVAHFGYLREDGMHVPAVMTISLEKGTTQVHKRFRLGIETHPAWSPDGSYIAFQSDNELYLLSFPEGKLRTVGSKLALRPGTLRWSSDGRRLAVLTWEESGEKTALVIVDPGSGEALRVADLEAGARGLEWHPDGRRLSYFVPWVSYRQVAVADGLPRPLFEHPGLRGTSFGRWQSAGTYIFRSYDTDANAWAVERFDSATNRTERAYDITGLPSWSENGRRLVWVEEHGW